ncbi:MAG: hypothetical protein JXA03_11800 [Bacteroidales bacterium]|nr:hypothetical protein [Bacteroidales bacterium]
MLAQFLKQKVTSLIVYCLATPLYSQVSSEIIGLTWYDLQTNGTMQPRLHIYDNGTIAAVWTQGFDHPSFPDRGSGYNFYDGDKWDPVPTGTVEYVCAGWPSIAPLGPEGEALVSHVRDAPGGLIINQRPACGQSCWTATTLYGPAGFEDICWSRMVTSGPERNNIHILALTREWGYLYHGQEMALLYYRSQDKGQTWDIQHHLFPELDSSHYLRINIDSYSWAEPLGDTIAFAVASRYMDMVLMKSVDGGDTWTKTVVWKHPYPFFDYDWTITTDTVFCCDGSFSLVLDENGKAHLAFGCGSLFHPEVGSFWGLLPPQDGIGYWNEYMPVFPGTHDALRKDSLEAGGNLIAEAQDVDGNGIVGFTDEYMPYRTGGICSMPSLAIGDHDDIYLVFSGLTEFYENGIYNFRHIWFRSSPDGGNTWGDYDDLTADLTGSGFSEYIYPSLFYNNGKLGVIYQEDPEPGLAVHSDHLYQENRIRYLNLDAYLLPPVSFPENEKVIAFEIFPNPASWWVAICTDMETEAVEKLVIAR